MRTVRIAQPKDHPSEHLRAVEGRPIARIVPVAVPAYAPRLIPPSRPFEQVRDLPLVRVDLGISSTELLLEERADR